MSPPVLREAREIRTTRWSHATLRTFVMQITSRSTRQLLRLRLRGPALTSGEIR